MKETRSSVETALSFAYHTPNYMGMVLGLQLGGQAFLKEVALYWPLPNLILNWPLPAKLFTMRSSPPSSVWTGIFPQPWNTCRMFLICFTVTQLLFGTPRHLSLPETDFCHTLPIAQPNPICILVSSQLPLLFHSTLPFPLAPSIHLCSYSSLSSPTTRSPHCTSLMIA